MALKWLFFPKNLQKIVQLLGALPPGLRLCYVWDTLPFSTRLQSWIFAYFNNYLKLSSFAKSCLNAYKQRFQIFHPMISLSHKSSSFENFWWCHCVWFVVWASLPIKNSGHAYKLEIAWKKILDIFFGEYLRLFPWFLASRGSVLEKAVLGHGLGFFFVSLALASSLVSSIPPLWGSINYILYKLHTYQN